MEHGVNVVTAKRTSNVTGNVTGNTAKKSTTSTSQASSALSSQLSSKNEDTWFHSIDIKLEKDYNHNGYFSHITVEFDADTHYDHEVVYGVLSLTDPNGVTTEYYTTDDFDLHGELASDRRVIETLLTSNWITDNYDLSIELFDAYNHQPLAFVDYHNVEALETLPLESKDYDNNGQHLSTFDSHLYLQHDDDGDGYYHAFNIDLDIDANFGSANIYAEIYVSTDQYSWLPLHTSDHFIVNANSTADTQHWEFEWLAGYPTSHYYVKVLIVDASSHETLLEVLPSGNPGFFAIPLEDASYEIAVAPAPVVITPPSTNKTTSSKESGGSFGGVMALLLVLAGIRRKR
ncbi:MAG: hypothetical protein ACI8WB_003436 [Phenylobacterium sp.]